MSKTLRSYPKKKRTGKRQSQMKKRARRTKTQRGSQVGGMHREQGSLAPVTITRGSPGPLDIWDTATTSELVHGVAGVERPGSTLEPSPAGIGVVTSPGGGIDLMLWNELIQTLVMLHGESHVCILLNIDSKTRRVIEKSKRYGLNAVQMGVVGTLTGVGGGIPLGILAVFGASCLLPELASNLRQGTASEVASQGKSVGPIDRQAFITNYKRLKNIHPEAPESEYPAFHSLCQRYVSVPV